MAVPRGVLVSEGQADEPLPFAAPWFVKAQIPTGGRGRAGGILRTETDTERKDALARLMGGHIKGHLVRECRIEQAVNDAREAYFSLSVAPATGLINVLVSPDEGGMDIDGAAHAACGRDVAAIRAQVWALAANFDEPARSALMEAGDRLAAIFCELEMTLLEINPLLVGADGAWVAGDAKLMIDENALVR